MQKSFDAGNVKFALFPAVIGGMSLTLDLITKAFFKNHALPQSSYVFGWLSFTLHQNFGLIGDMQIPFAVLVAVNIVALVALFCAVYWSWEKKSMSQLAFLGLVLGGALGNLYDRLVHGYVFDWLMLFNTSIINLADIWITLGIVGYLACLLTAKQNQEI